jgi:hypothetical protein
LPGSDNKDFTLEISYFDDNVTPDPPTPDLSLHHRDAGLFSSTAGIIGAASFMALGFGPGWLSFAVAFLPASVKSTWAIAMTP